jgi:hypothetical protein
MDAEFSVTLHQPQPEVFGSSVIVNPNTPKLAKLTANSRKQQQARPNKRKHQRGLIEGFQGLLRTFHEFPRILQTNRLDLGVAAAKFGVCPARLFGPLVDFPLPLSDRPVTVA